MKRFINFSKTPSMEEGAINMDVKDISNVTRYDRLTDKPAIRALGMKGIVGNLSLRPMFSHTGSRCMIVRIGDEFSDELKQELAKQLVSSNYEVIE